MMSRNRAFEDPYARLFVGSLNTNEVNKTDLFEVFSKYGTVQNVSVHRSYAFIQFEKVPDAKVAQRNEDGKVVKGCRMNVKFSNVEGRTSINKSRDRSRSPLHNRKPYYDQSKNSQSSSYSSNKSWGGPSPADRPSWGATPPAPQYPGPGPMGPPVPPSGGWGYPPAPAPMGWGPVPPASGPPPPMPYGPTPDYMYPPTGDYRYPPRPDHQAYSMYGAPPEPYKKDVNIGDASRRDDTQEMSGQKCNDCEVIVMNTHLRKYAEMIEQCLKGKGMRVDLLFPTDHSAISGIIADITSRGVLYAVVVSGQNEEHQSMTVNILHGVPEEHRNMPLSDALSLMSKDFETVKNKTSQKVTPALPESETVHPSNMRRLFSILADDRELSVGEYDKAIDYLKSERENIAQKYGFAPRSDVAGKPLASVPKREPSPPGTDASPANQQQDLNQRILSLLSSGNVGSKSSANATIQKAIEVLVKGKGSRAEQNGSYKY